MRSSGLLLLCLAACSPAADTQSAGAREHAAAPVLDQAAESVKIDNGAELVRAHCSACHSLALVYQNRMTRDGWISTIRWMQEKQGLWDLGEAEEPILDYLEENYGVADIPWRRKPLEHLGSG